MQATLEELANSEYLKHEAPGCARETPFGTFVHDPEFPGRTDATQLLRARCRAEQIEDFLVELERRYAETGLSFRRVSGHDAATFAALGPELRRRGYAAQVHWGLIKALPAERAVAPEVRVELVDAGDERVWATYAQAGRGPTGLAQQRKACARLGGQLFVAFRAERAVGASGWFEAGELARYWFVDVTADARGQGVGTSLVRHIAEHSAAAERRAVVIFSSAERAVALYERLGFVRQGFVWNFTRVLG